MKRRRFLGLLGAGAAGGLAGGTALGARNTAPEEPPTRPDEDEIEPASSGLHRVIWSVDTTRPAAALTFDDGPDPRYTPRILDILDHYKAPATFMVMGSNAVRHPVILREVVAGGHEVGGHGWKHLNLTKATPQEVRKEIVFGTRKIEEVAGTPVRVFRPPYGRFSERSVRLLGNAQKDLVIWSVTRGDLGLERPRDVAAHVVRSTGAGDIVDLHDGLGRGTFNPRADFTARLMARREVEVHALPQIIEGLRDKGLRLTTVSDLVADWRPSDV